jgi:23S rRNA (cytosine1962-C5)-methyltransferase
MQLKPGRERSILNRHPWIFSGAFQDIPTNLEDGEIIEILDANKKFLAYGHYCKDASLACRLFHIGDKILINDDFWKARFRQALELRKQLGFALDNTEAYRLFYAEGDNLPGIICDVFGKNYSLQLKTKGAENLKPLITSFLQDELGLTEANSECRFIEDKLSFIVDAKQGQKTGYFLDQRDNRRLVGHYAKNKRVLDVFSYSGGFSLYALANHAAHVTTLDISELYKTL